MTTTPTSGAAIQRYKIGYHADEWGQRSSTPSGIPDASGSWVRYADHVTALAAGQPGAAYAALPDGVATLCEYGGDVFTAAQMRAFADATHTLRASHGQAPASVLHLANSAFAEIAMAFPKAFALHKVGVADKAVLEALAAPAGAQAANQQVGDVPESLVLAVDQWFADNIKDSGGCTSQDVHELAVLFYGVTHEGGIESVDDALAIVESFGPGIGGLNDAYARQVLLAEEVKRLRGQAPNPERTGELLMGLAVIRELTGTQQKGLEETIEAVRAAVNAQKHPPAPATMAVNDDLRDWLVAISAAVADQDDRAAQAMLREILKTPQPSPTARADSVQEDAAREAIEKVLALFPFNVPTQKFSINNGPCLTADNDDEFYSVKRVLAFLTAIKTTLDAAQAQAAKQQGQLI